MLQINSNGSKWYGQEPDTIEQLIEVLNTEPLDPVYEDYGNFVNRNPQWLKPELQEKYKGCTVIGGNFARISYVFNIITDEQDIIELLTKAIRNNQQTKEYQQIRSEYIKTENRKKEARNLFEAGEITLQEMYARYI